MAQEREEGGSNTSVKYVCSGCKRTPFPEENLDKNDYRLYPVEFEDIESCQSHIRDTHGEGKAQATKVIKFYRSKGEFGFLSNLFPAKVWFEQRDFLSAEYAYQFAKPKEKAVAEWLVSAPKAHLCALTAHALFAFDINPNWNSVKVERMTRVIRAKFLQNLDLGIKLLETGDAILVEESNMDAFWGIGKKGKGQNMLGKLLMQVRSELKDYGSGVQRIGVIRITSQFDDDQPLPVRVCRLADSGYRAMEYYLQGKEGSVVKTQLFQAIEYCAFIEQASDDEEAKKEAKQVKSLLQKVLESAYPSSVLSISDCKDLQVFFTHKRREHLIPALANLKRKETEARCERQLTKNAESIQILTKTTGDPPCADT